MKRVRFRDHAGTVRTGEWLDSDGTPAEDDVAGTDAGVIRFADREYDPTEVTLLPPCEPSKIVCIGRNYAAHAAELDNEVPDRPLLFLKPPNAVAPPGAEVSLLPDKDRIDYEAELAVVIGEQCRNVDAADALDVVAGYTCMVDVSNREDQDREQNWIRGKAFDGAAPLGPVVADPEHVPDDARIRLRQNGDVRQDSTRDLLFFDVPTLVEEITTYLTLEPGDVIATGTPEGVGPLAPGDEVEVEVEGIGRLRHGVSAP
jgi:2-keto-4-pentenoate hydratase/2-oxohepta-3-ene-1,7-dioic acid hydratase in catechol pathway